MAKIDAHKIVNPGVSSNITPQVASVRKTTYAINRLGQTIASVGRVTKAIESIEVARIKNDKLREKIERERARREADEAAESAAEINKIEKGKLKVGKLTNLKKGKTGSLLKSILPPWLSLLSPVFEWIARLVAFPLIRETLKWWADPENKEKIETFFYKANVIFTKLKSFGDWLVNDKILGGWNKFKTGDTFLERIGGLGELMTGIGIIAVILSPLKALGAALTGLGWLIKNLTGWLKDPFGWLKKGKVQGGRNLPEKVKNKNGTSKTKLKNKYQKWVESNKKKHTRKIKFDKTKIGNTKIKVPNKAPYIPPKGSGTLKPKGWKGVLSKVKNWGKKAKMPKFLKGAGKYFGPTATTVLSGLELHDRLVNQDQSPEKAITGTAAGAVGGVAGFTLGAKGAALALSPLLVTPVPGARLVYGAGVVAAGIAGSWGGSTAASTISDKAFDAHEDDDKRTKWYNPWSWNQKKKEEPKPEPKKNESKSKWSWSSLWGGNKKEKQQNVVVPKEESKKKKKPWWKLWEKGGQHKLPQFFFGKIFKGISKAVSGVVSGVTKAVGSVVKTVGNVVSNPIVSTALSFVPGVGPIVQGINAINSLRQGNIMGAVMGGVGALGNFAAIGSTAQSVVNTPNWMMNLRMSKFGQGLAGMYNSGAKIWGNIASGFNNFMGTDIGKLGKGIYTGMTGGGWGGAISQVGSMTGLTAPGGLFGQGGFFGEGGRASQFGDFLNKYNLAGIGNMFPGVADFISNSPLGSLPGFSELFGGQFSAMGALGGMAERAGVGGLFNSVMGMYSGTTDAATGIRNIAEELGVGAEVFGILDKGRSLMDRSKQFALEQPDVELIPLVLPIIKGEVTMAAAIKKKLIVAN